MRFLSVFAIAVSAVIAGQTDSAVLSENELLGYVNGFKEQTITSFEDVFGPVEKSKQRSLNSNPMTRQKNTFTTIDKYTDKIEDSEFWESYREVRTVDNCIFPFEILILQDTTHSFLTSVDDSIVNQFDKLAETLENTHEGSTFGLVTLRDKPIAQFGNETHDFCFKTLAPLSSDISIIKDHYSRIHLNAGGDFPENQLGALYGVVARNDVGFFKDPKASRLIILISDSTAHFEGDGDRYRKVNSGPPHKFIDFIPVENGSDFDYESKCMKEYYPTPQQTKEGLKKFFPGGYLSVAVPENANSHKETVDDWQWFSDYIGQSGKWVHTMRNDYSNIWQVMMDMVAEARLEECIYPGSTTTVEPPVPTKPEEPHTPPKECECETSGNCECPEVIIKLAKRPSRMHLKVINDI